MLGSIHYVHPQKEHTGRPPNKITEFSRAEDSPVFRHVTPTGWPFVRRPFGHQGPISLQRVSSGVAPKSRGLCEGMKFLKTSPENKVMGGEKTRVERDTCTSVQNIHRMGVGCALGSGTLSKHLFKAKHSSPQPKKPGLRAKMARCRRLFSSPRNGSCRFLFH